MRPVRAVSSDLGIDLSELTRGVEVAEMPELASKGGYRVVAMDVDPVLEFMMKNSY